LRWGCGDPLCIWCFGRSVLPHCTGGIATGPLGGVEGPGCFGCAASDPLAHLTGGIRAEGRWADVAGQPAPEGAPAGGHWVVLPL
jgi:hypothetical protein